MNRRGFLQACLASATAPYVVTTAGVLMPVRKLLRPDLTEASLEAMIIEISRMTDARGLRIQVNPTKILAQRGLLDDALRICPRLSEWPMRACA